MLPDEHVAPQPEQAVGRRQEAVEVVDRAPERPADRAGAQHRDPAAIEAVQLPHVVVIVTSVQGQVGEDVDVVDPNRREPATQHVDDLVVVRSEADDPLPDVDTDKSRLPEGEQGVVSAARRLVE